MVTSRLKTIFALSIPLFIAHALEEYITKFYERDAWDEFFPARFVASPEQAGVVFLLVQVVLVCLLLGVLLFRMNERVRCWLFAGVGLLYVYELIHIVRAFLAGTYYPGLITAILFIPVALVFWREWFHIRRDVLYE